MKVNYEGIWQERTNVGYLASLAVIYTKRFGSNEYPETLDECMQMLFDRVELNAEEGYWMYLHEWNEDNLPKKYTLEELVKLAKEVFIGCNIDLKVTEIKSVSSSSSNPPVVDKSYQLVIDWSSENEITTTTTSRGSD